MLECIPEKPVEHTIGKINPAKTCQPLGAMYASLGIHGCLPHSHGSQGCCAYHRMHLTRHFREPVLASSSSFTEGASVFGGAANLKTSIKNVFEIYNPDIRPSTPPVFRRRSGTTSPTSSSNQRFRRERSSSMPTRPVTWDPTSPGSQTCAGRWSPTLRNQLGQRRKSR